MLRPLALLGLLLFCFSEVSAADAVLKYCLEGLPAQTDPNRAIDTVSENALSQQIFNRLIEVDSRTGGLVPGLASKWEISKDLKKYTFHLRSGVHFHSTDEFKPTRDFNADDVLATMRRMMNPGKETFSIFDSYGLRKLIKAVNKKDDLTVEFELNEPSSELASALSHPGNSIQSAEYLAAREKNSSLLPIGTGPFVLEKYKNDEFAKYRAHVEFWKGAPKFSKLVISFVPDSSVRLQKLRAGECDFISDVLPSDRADLQKDGRFQLFERVGINTGYIGFNMDKFKELKVRQAIAAAIDVIPLIESVYSGRADPASQPIPPGVSGHDKAIKVQRQDLKRAAKLLAEAKVTLPMKLKLMALPISRPYNPSGKKMAELIQSDLKKVGIEIEVVQYDWTTFLAKAKAGEFDLLMLGGNYTSSDPGNFLSAFLSCVGIGGFNSVRYCNPKFDELLAKARSTASEPAREKFFKQSMQIVMADLPWVPIAHGKIARASRTGLKDYYLGPAGREDFAKASFFGQP